MTNDPLERLRRLNPVTEDVTAPPIETVLRLRALEPDPPRARSRPGVSVGPLIPVLTTVLVLAIAALALLTLTHRSQHPNRSASPAVPTGAQQLVSELAVLRRPQTTADRALPAWWPRFQRLTKRQLYASAVPGLTRLVATLPGDDKVFMFVLAPTAPRGSAPRNTAYQLGLLSINPHGAGGGGAGTASFLYRDLQPGCFNDASWSVIPDGITRVRWIFARQDRLGFVYPKALTIEIPVKNNIAIAEIPERAPCVSPAVVRWYAADGHIVASQGSLAGIDRIRRPVRHGKPWGP